MCCEKKVRCFLIHKMTTATKDSLTKSLKAILKDGDLDNLSAKKIRRMLEAEYKTDFTERKDEIDKLVMELISKMENDDGKEDEEEKDNVQQNITNGSKPSKPAASSNKPCNDFVKQEKSITNDDLEDEDEEEDDSDLAEVEDKVPKKKAKVHSSSKISKKVNDEYLAKQLQEDDGLRPSRRCKAQPVVRKQKKPRKEGAKGNSVYSRPCALLPPLDDIMGTDKMPRPMIVKKLWEIVKERDLLDPKNRQYMLCDSEMLGLFGKRRVRMFAAMKLLKPYIKDLPKE